MDLSSLTDGLFVTSTSGDDSDHGSGVTLDGSLDTGRHLDSGLEPIFGVTDDEGVGSGSSGELTVVTGVLLNVADDGSFGDTVDGKHVSDGELGLDSAVDVLTGVHTLSSEEELGVHAVFMGVSELDLGQRSSSTGVMDDLSDNTLDVSTSQEVAVLTPFSRRSRQDGTWRVQLCAECGTCRQTWGFPCARL